MRNPPALPRGRLGLDKPPAGGTRSGNRKVDAANQMKLVGLNIMRIFKFRIQCVRLRRLARDSSGAYRGKRSCRPDQN
ncbi:MAG: hypothetical protein LBQ12_15450 [Deltaproteobacteria bacterium]|jgi:hypothetical protein|nr:hypothetical protein [Deltaproteobacteria bacterium]